MHVLITGVGLDAVIETLLSGARSAVTLDRIGYNDRYIFDLGSRDYLHGLSGMDNACIAARVRKLNG